MFLRLLVVALVGASLHAQSPSPALTVCELLSQASAYNGKMVTIRGVDSSTDEGLWLKDAKCASIDLAGTRWPVMLWITTPAMSRESPGFEFDEASWSAVMAEYRRKWRSVPDRCVEFTYTGIFRTRRNWEDFKTTFPDGRVMYLGFGHVNGAPGELLIKSADRVERIKDCK